MFKIEEQIRKDDRIKILARIIFINHAPSEFSPRVMWLKRSEILYVTYQEAFFQPNRYRICLYDKTHACFELMHDYKETEEDAIDMFDKFLIETGLINEND